MHWSYLPALRDLRVALRFNWGGAAFGTVYGFLGDASRREQAVAGLLESVGGKISTLQSTTSIHSCILLLA